MTKIEFRYRPYKDPNKRGTYLLINGRQSQRVSARQLSLSEMNRLRKQMLLSDKGYIQQNAKKFQKQIADDQIKEVNVGELNTEVVDINKDPTSNEWKKEKKVNRDYLSFDDDQNQLDKMI